MELNEQVRYALHCWCIIRSRKYLGSFQDISMVLKPQIEHRFIFHCRILDVAPLIVCSHEHKCLLMTCY